MESEKKKEWRKNYRKIKWAEKRKEMVEYLGGVCKLCGSTTDLEFDHIDPTNKSFDVSAKLLNRKEGELLKEFEKCQLLCHVCHVTKTKEEERIRLSSLFTSEDRSKINSRVRNRRNKIQQGEDTLKTHGLNGYNYGCRCAICTTTRNEYRRERRKKGLRP